MLCDVNMNQYARGPPNHREQMFPLDLLLFDVNSTYNAIYLSCCPSFGLLDFLCKLFDCLCWQVPKHNHYWFALDPIAIVHIDYKDHRQTKNMIFSTWFVNAKSLESQRLWQHSPNGWHEWRWVNHIDIVKCICCRWFCLCAGRFFNFYVGQNDTCVRQCMHRRHFVDTRPLNFDMWVCSSWRECKNF